MYAENLGNGSFKLIPLPKACQVAPINDILIEDFDNDGQLDAVMVGNDFSSETHYGRYDALTGIFLKGTDSFFDAIPSRKSGFYVPGQSHYVISAKNQANSSVLIAPQNKDRLKVFSFK